MSDLHQEPERDQFKTESPIRAFTTWTVEGSYAIGKGFRPSLQHVVTYLDAMRRKEGWEIVQILEATSQTPSFLFRRAAKNQIDDNLYAQFLEGLHVRAAVRSAHPLRQTAMSPTLGMPYQGVTDPIMPELREKFESTQRDYGDETPEVTSKDTDTPEPAYEVREKVTLDDVDAFLKDQGLALTACSDGAFRMYKADEMELVQNVTGKVIRTASKAPPTEAIGDDAINPQHYNGRACADIGERLSANGYQILKYCWRLGKKDDPCQELGKALWYAESEALLLKATAHRQGYRHTAPNVTGLKDPDTFLEGRIDDQPQFTQTIARMLWAGYSQRQLQAIVEAITEHRFHLECGRGLAI